MVPISKSPRRNNTPSVRDICGRIGWVVAPVLRVFMSMFYAFCAKNGLIKVNLFRFDKHQVGIAVPA
jgi:hypothetical protein